MFDIRQSVYHEPTSVACVYHSADLDGQCSVAIVADWYNTFCKGSYKQGFISIGWDYGKLIDYEKFRNQNVFLVDLSWKYHEIIELCSVANHVIWIDHHQSSLEEIKKIHEIDNLEVVLSTEFAACKLVWNYLWSQEFTIPECVELLSLYDNWQWKEHDRSEDIINFQMGMRNQNTSLHEEFFWAKMLHTSHLIEEMIVSGKEIQKYQTSQNARLANANSFVTELDGIKCLAVNASGGSEVFDSIVDQHKDCEVMILFQVRKNAWSVSMRSETIDVGSICKAHGGGGHRGAAGFVCKELPFKLPF